MTPVSKPVVPKKAVPVSKKEAKPEEKKIEGPNGSTRGLTWGLNLHHTFIRLMEEQPKKKLDDEKIIDFLLKEFPNRENKTILRLPREIRWRYNFGKLHEDKDGNPNPPAVKALRYNPDGTVYEKAVKAKVTAEEKALRAEERKSKELERRAEELKQLADAEDRLAKMKERITTRQTEWEARNGKLEVEKPTIKKPKVVIKKK
jgi:hypothetical protein